MQLIDTIQSIYQNINKNAVSHNDSLYQCSNSTFHDDRFWVLFDWEPSLKRQLFKIFAWLASQLDCLQSALNKINIQKACICLHNTLKYYMNDYLYLHYWREALCILWIAAASTIKAGSHCNADLRECNVTDVLGQCEHCSSVIAVAVLIFGVSSEKFGSVKLFR